eukprot:scaffold563263_cov22-Prasinocladus_malaysianus.AAC.1
MANALAGAAALTAHFMLVPSCLTCLLNFRNMDGPNHILVTRAARITPHHDLLITLALGLAEKIVLLDWAAAEGG